MGFLRDEMARRCINIQKQRHFLHIYAMRCVCFDTKKRFYAMFGETEKALKSRVFVREKTPLQWLLDAIMMLTFFDAVVIAIATCSYRDSNMMLST